MVLRQAVDMFFSGKRIFPLLCLLSNGKIAVVLRFIYRLYWLCPGKGGLDYFIEAVSLEYL